MKQCQNCKTWSPDASLFCGRCQSTFGAKICPHGHANPATVSFCLTCGSENLSRPDRYPEKISRHLIFVWALVLVMYVLFIAYVVATY